MSHSEIIKRVLKTPDNIYGIKRIKSIPGDEVCVLYLGGNGTTTTRAANGNAKIIEQQVTNVFSDDIPIYSVVYDFDEHDEVGARAKSKYIYHGNNRRFGTHKYIYLTEKNMNGKIIKDILPIFFQNKQVVPRDKLKLNLLFLYTDEEPEYIKEVFLAKLRAVLTTLGYNLGDKDSICSNIASKFSNNNLDTTEYIDDLFQKVLLPRISDNNERLPLNIAMQRIRKLNIITHSFGGYVAQRLGDITQERMHNLGYSTNEIKQILSQLLIVAHAPSYRPKNSKTHFFGFMSAYDSFVSLPHNWVTEYISQLRNQDSKYMTANNLTGVKHEWLANGPVFLGGNNGNLFLVARSFKYGNQDDGGYGPHKNEHGNTNYIKMPDQTKDGFVLNLIARNILRNGIRNSLIQNDGFVPLPNNADLIKWSDKESNMVPSFENMEHAGKDFMKSVYHFAISKLASTKDTRILSMRSPNQKD